MKASATRIPEVILFQPRVYHDDRGFLYESYNRKVFEEAVGYGVDFVQENHSVSTRGVLRGLHHQIPPKSQAKLVRVVQGEIFDVAVDIRRSSPTFGQWVGELLSADNQRQMWIPAGFAHGFLALTNNAVVVYKAGDSYSPKHERCILWNDATLAIDWPLQGQPRVSDRDSQFTVRRA